MCQYDTLRGGLTRAIYEPPGGGVAQKGSKFLMSPPLVACGHRVDWICADCASCVQCCNCTREMFEASGIQSEGTVLHVQSKAGQQKLLDVRRKKLDEHQQRLADATS